MCRFVRLALVRISSRLPMSDSAQANSTPPTTIVLLGASNLTRAISTVVETLSLQHQPPLRIVTALGYGRSYGMGSCVLARSLCSILDCGIWKALQENNSGAPRFALLTDIGNDVMYGATPKQIVGWIEECIDRLQALGVDCINITALPLGSLRTVRRWQYVIVRTILFPTRRISYETAMSNAVETQKLIEELAQRRAPLCNLVEQDGSWYGFDPIHIRLRHWSAAWARFLATSAADQAKLAVGSFKRWLRLRLHMPARYYVFGLQRFRRQPLCIDDTTSIEIY